MAFWLASKREGQTSDWIQRFDPRFWTVNFPRPMGASVITTDHDGLRIDANFLRKQDLAGLIWESVDRIDHPLLAYRTQRDYAHCVLSFRWRSGGIIPLDQPNGPTLTIEGRDQAGQPRTWYVRLWNYAVGSPTDAQIKISFSDVKGGWNLATDADPVWPGDIDRMFISLVAPGYNGASEDPLPLAVDGWARLTEMLCTGRYALLEIGDVVVPPHGHAIATGFDDNGTQTPARLLRNVRQLGYRGSIVHYVGMSHYFQLRSEAGGYEINPLSTLALSKPTREWHLSFFKECDRLGYSPITSLSYEILDQHCPAAWKQRDADGNPALTGWDPPSTLLSPANPDAMNWLQRAAGQFIDLMIQAGVPLRFQVGEPWWWQFADGRICIYDSFANDALDNPPAIPNLRLPLNSAQQAALDAAGTLLAQSTAQLVQAARIKAGSRPLEALLLVFPPTLLDPSTPDARRANLPVEWASPAFDRLQVEDYDWLTAGADGNRRAAYEIINDRLGYLPEDQDYFAGFVLLAEQADKWRLIDAGIDEARLRNPHEIFVWALPQVCRDGYVRLPDTQDETDMQAFDDVLYPLALGRDATVIPEFSTSVSVTASGFERRNSLWSNARLRFDVGPGIRSEAELGDLIAFFRARRGPARGFRLRDPSDYSSKAMVGTPTAQDQLLGIGDGSRSDFALRKRYGEGTEQQERRITRPVFESIIISINGFIQVGNWSLLDGGVISFETPPQDGALVRAGFLFDVPVRFAQDSLEIAGASFAAGEAPSVPVVEIKEAA
jgi:uncharacterized protein (TIGR02217 family)